MGRKIENSFCAVGWVQMHYFKQLFIYTLHTHKMKGFLIIISVLFLSGCWVHRDLISFKSTNYNEFNFVDHQVHFEIVKDQKSQTFPFVFVEKSGKKDRWLVSASFITPEIELASITIDVTITNLQGEVLFEANDRKVELIEFDDYRAKAFDFGTFEKKEPTNLQDTLLAIYHVNTLKIVEHNPLLVLRI